MFTAIESIKFAYIKYFLFNHSSTNQTDLYLSKTTIKRSTWLYQQPYLSLISLSTNIIGFKDVLTAK